MKAGARRQPDQADSVAVQHLVRTTACALRWLGQKRHRESQEAALRHPQRRLPCGRGLDQHQAPRPGGQAAKCGVRAHVPDSVALTNLQVELSGLYLGVPDVDLLLDLFNGAARASRAHQPNERTVHIPLDVNLGHPWMFAEGDET